jgi:SnoaL-like domain
MHLHIEDRVLIGDLVVAYAYAVDEKNWTAFEALFTQDAQIDYRSAGGIAGTPAELAAWMPQAMATFSWSMHSLSTHRLQFTSDDAATGSLHVFARHGLTWEGAAELMDVSAVYHDRYARTPAGWRFAARREETLTITGGRFAAMVSARIQR